MNEVKKTWKLSMLNDVLSEKQQQQNFRISNTLFLQQNQLMHNTHFAGEK